MSTTQDNVTRSSSNAEVSLSKVDEGAIRSLASELRVPVDLVEEIYTRELARLAPHARVKAFLPLVVGCLVRRRAQRSGGALHRASIAA
jgi:hypothetical protein